MDEYSTATSQNMIKFIFFTVEVATTKEEAVTPSTGKKVMDYASKLSFLNQFRPTSIDRRDTDSLSIGTKHNADITIHPNGSFHIEMMGGSIDTLVTVERWISRIANLFVKSGAKGLQFDIEFRSHTDIESKTQLAAISRIFNSLLINSALANIQRLSTPTYLVTRIRPHSSTKSMFISYHPEFVELSLRLRPLTPKMMKNRFLINAAEALIDVLIKQLGDNS